MEVKILEYNQLKFARLWLFLNTDNFWKIALILGDLIEEGNIEILMLSNFWLGEDVFELFENNISLVFSGFLGCGYKKILQIGFLRREKLQ